MITAATHFLAVLDFLETKNEMRMLLHNSKKAAFAPFHITKTPIANWDLDLSV